MGAWKIVVHPNPDIDALAGAWALRRFGGDKYLGISDAEIVTHNGSLRKEPGMIFVDCGGQDFDHHPPEKFPEECALSLIVKHLGVEDDPCLEKILKMVLASDLKGGDNPFSLAQLVKDLNFTFSDEPGKVIAWAINALEAKYNSQLEFLFSEHGTKFEKIEVELLGNMVRCIYAAETSSQSFSRWARYKGAALVVQRNPETGQVQIFSDKRVPEINFVIEDILRAVRVEEAEIKKLSPLSGGWDRITSEGTIPEIPEWYYHKVGLMVLNGSLTNPQVPPTKIPWNKIKNLVRIALSPELPNPGCRSRGVCFPRCDYREHGLWRCRKLRYESLHKKPSSSPAPPAG